jgi:hypothetical protein
MSCTAEAFRQELYPSRKGSERKLMYAVLQPNTADHVQTITFLLKLLRRGSSAAKNDSPTGRKKSSNVSSNQYYCKNKNSQEQGSRSYDREAR